MPNCEFKHDGFRVAYSSKEARPILVTSVPSGLQCKCVCMGCHKPLVAVHPRSRAAYFRHHNPSNNDHGGCNNLSSNAESITHYLVKHHIAKTKELMLPGYQITKHPDKDGCFYQPYIVIRPRKVKFDTVSLEQRENGFIPDCIGTIGQNRLMVEVKVSHGVDIDKLDKIRYQQLSMVELTIYDRIEDENDPVLEKVTSSVGNIEWLNAPRLLNTQSQIKAAAHFKKQREKFEALKAQEEARAKRQAIIEKDRERQGLIKIALKIKAEQWGREYLDKAKFIKEDECNVVGLQTRFRHEVINRMSTTIGRVNAWLSARRVAERLPAEGQELVNYFEPLVAKLDFSVRALATFWIRTRNEKRVGLSEFVASKLMLIKRAEIYRVYQECMAAEGESQADIAAIPDAERPNWIKQWMELNATHEDFIAQANWDDAKEIHMCEATLSDQSKQAIEDINSALQGIQQKAIENDQITADNIAIMDRCKQTFLKAAHCYFPQLFSPHYQIYLDKNNVDDWIDYLSELYVRWEIDRRWESHCDSLHNIKASLVKEWRMQLKCHSIEQLEEYIAQLSDDGEPIRHDRAY